MGAYRITEAARRASTYLPGHDAKVMEMVAQLHDGINLDCEHQVIATLFLCGHSGADINTYLDRVIEKARALRKGRTEAVWQTAVAGLGFLTICSVIMVLCGAGAAHAATLTSQPPSQWPNAFGVLFIAVCVLAIVYLICAAVARMVFPERYSDPHEDPDHWGIG